MSKLTNAAIVELLKAKGLDLAEDSPHLLTVAASMKIDVGFAHAVQVCYRKPKSRVNHPEGTEGAKPFVIANGSCAAWGQDELWFKVHGSVEDTLAGIQAALNNPDFPVSSPEETVEIVKEDELRAAKQAAKKKAKKG